MVLFSGLPRRQFSVHFALLIAAESTLGALLEPPFRTVSEVESSEVRRSKLGRSGRDSGTWTGSERGFVYPS